MFICRMQISTTRAKSPGCELGVRFECDRYGHVYVWNSPRETASEHFCAINHTGWYINYTLCRSYYLHGYCLCSVHTGTAPTAPFA